MNKKLIILGATALIGIGLFIYTMWSQAAPVTRDPDIGAGLIGLLAAAAGIFGILGFVLELINSRKRHH
jgi:uncharacterized iron-regulated membrane protein